MFAKVTKMSWTSWKYSDGETPRWQHAADVEIGNKIYYVIYLEGQTTVYAGVSDKPPF